jgi:dihydroorotase
LDRIILNSPFDAHLHLRDEELLKKVFFYSENQFVGGVVMPNLQPPITTKRDIISYKNRILSISKKDFTPYMTLFFSNSYTKEFLESVKELIISVKLYPNGVTTNSENGVKSLDLKSLETTLSAMENLGIPLSIHGETDGDIFNREFEFIPIYEMLASKFPNLKIIMEHISDSRTIDLLDKYQNLYATVTLHHLLFTIDDLLGGALKPHLFCKPIIKFQKDRDALQELVLNGHSKVMFGSDSAPHLKEDKEIGGNAGIFSAPILLPKLVEFFEENNKLENLQNFISNNSQKIFNLHLPKREITLIKKDFIVPNNYNGVVPLLAGEKIKWSLI